MPPSLIELGWKQPFIDSFKSFLENEATDLAAALVPARIIEQGKDLFRAASERGELLLTLPRAQFHRLGEAALPCVGDWVAMEYGASRDRGVLRALLSRAGLLARNAPGSDGGGGSVQMLAANVDVAFVVTSLNDDLNRRRLERYLALIHGSGARPVVVLSKADLLGDSSNSEAAAIPHDEIRETCGDTPILIASIYDGRGLAELRQLLRSSGGGMQTGVLVGSSGVGKSSLVNALLGREVAATRDIRENDSRGRHTTTVRHLHLLPGGGVLIDTPGLREIQLASDHSDVDGAFHDIADLETRCRFGDCQHRSEPGCAILAALASGALDEARYLSYQKLKREVEYAERKTNKAKASEARNLWKKRHRAADVRAALERGNRM